MNQRRAVIKELLFVILILLSYSSSALQSSVRHKTQVSSNHRSGSKEPLASEAKFSPSLQYDEADTKHTNPSGSGKIEPPLVRLKRIKREMVRIGSLKTLDSNKENIKTEALHDDDVTAKVPEKSRSFTDLRHFNAEPHLESNSARAGIHKELLRRVGELSRKTGSSGKGRGIKMTQTKTNEIMERRPEHHIQDGGRHHTVGTGSYLHHKHEQDRLESVAESALRQRSRKKSKHQRNRSDLTVKGTSGGSYTMVPRMRQFGPGDRISEGHLTRFHEEPGRSGIRGQAAIKGQANIKAKQKSVRGPKSKVSTTKNGSRSQNVRVEMERIKRMQRDLLKEINHLEHMKKKKKKIRSANQGLIHKTATPKRK